MKQISVAELELTKFKAQPQLVEMYRNGVASLRASGIFHFLRIFARPFTVDRGGNPYSAAYTAAYSEGYNKCLDDIAYFDELYLTEHVGNKAIKANFGGLGIAVAKGDLTEEEAKSYGAKAVKGR